MQKSLFTLFVISVLMQACSAAPQVSNTPRVDSLNVTSTSAAPMSRSATPDVSSSLTVAQNQVQPTTTPVLSADFWKDLPIVPSTLSDQVREIYQRGLLMGNDPQAFSKVGDCHSTNPYFLADYDLGSTAYDLGEYSYMQPTIDYFGGSFGRASLAAKQGLSTAGVLAPLWADWKQCSNNETPLDCELRKHHPSFEIVSLGTNEAYDVKKDRSTFEPRLRRIIEHSIDQGVVPILSTKADNDEGDHFINFVTARLAMEYQLPLWNFWRAVQPLPRQGMRSSDHLTFAPTLSFSDFSKPEYLDYGMQMRNLTALEVLDMVRREILQPQLQATVMPQPVTAATAPVMSQLGDETVSSLDGMILLHIPGAEFEMGSASGNPNSAPVHTVTLNEYWMDGTEVTNLMFAKFLNTFGNKTEGGVSWLNVRDPQLQIFEQDGTWQVQPGKENYPIVSMSWYAANAYCEWTGRRLPTEAEWEYAASASNGRLFPWNTDDLDCDHARYLGCGSGTVQTGSLPLGVSPFGLFEMAGNVSEWVNDRYAEDYYQISPSSNPTGPVNGYYRVIRGGSWHDNYLALRTTRRGWAGADKHDSTVGFRCALTP